MGENVAIVVGELVDIGESELRVIPYALIGKRELAYLEPGVEMSEGAQGFEVAAALYSNFRTSVSRKANLGEAFELIGLSRCP